MTAKCCLPCFPRKNLISRPKKGTWAMCGIAGYFGPVLVERENILSTMRQMVNRGPDFQDFRVFEKGGLNVLLVHSRLGIIDLDNRSNQPFTIGNFTVVFNGEIYNYLELRKILEGKGEHFLTDSDTEVLLRAYMIFGRECVSKFEGMWSFAIWNAVDGELFLSRDRFAEKPLYYTLSDGGFWFASEIKFIEGLSGRRFQVNKQHILRYIVNGYKSLYKTNENFLLDVRELPFASNMMVGMDVKPVIWKYWVASANETNMTFEDAVNGARDALVESMRLRLRADVPLAFCLSGGIDSSLLASIAAKRFSYNVAAFSIIDSDERYDETDNIDATLADIGCSCTKIHISRTGTIDRLCRLIEYHDAPIATITYLVHSMLSEEISRQGFRVAVSGTGADELFTGYYDHYNLQLYELHGTSNYDSHLEAWRRHIMPIVRNPHLKDPELYVKNRDFRDHIYRETEDFSFYLVDDFREDFVERQYSDSLLRNRMMNELFHESIPVILHEDDLNSMKYSIENRSPYLDSNLFRFAYSIPAEMLIREGYNKFILREAARGVLNEKVRTDRRKRGFNASIYSLIDFDCPDTMDFLFSGSSVFDIIDRGKLIEAIRRKPSSNSFSKFLFSFINARIFMDSRAVV